MLSGKELGHAIEVAINKKISSGAIKTKAEVARHFKIKPPSIHDWIKKGSISKDKLPELWNYFSDVAGPEHWGLKEIPIMERSQPHQDNILENNQIHDAYLLATEERRAVVDFLLSVNTTAEPAWVDSDVRAYVNALDAKSRRWLNENKLDGNKTNPKKTGT
ncbi:TPA: hypothetical protein PXJ37_002486 [Yersinia enterocolitica]|uniref:DNA-binding transcriptional repressor RacR n=1 Tax=Yersinia enterocolitica TaxID=630 RepID=UPI0028BCAD4B|nr:hypothetical protein [Yersinia enterocolitica]ELI7912029.1 hypothetical protein [Yersinia enterocolitica]ELW8237457.1 hypothetical protein [Yersinia enterocolitica]HDL6612900.1 hypothetical protein [Yersinia enterocolitica]HEI6841444.1 hypothetical protein [Yersinia enterocolitica]